MKINKYHIQFVLIALISLGVIPFFKIVLQNQWHLYYAGHLYGLFCIVLAIIIVKNNGWSLKSLGVRFDNIKRAILPYFIFTAIWVIIIFALKIVLHKNPDPDWTTDIHYRYMFLVSAIIQEFFYRSFLVRLQKQIFSNTTILVLVNALLFSLIHLIFGNDIVVIMTSFTFLLGAGYASLYLKYPNFYLASISHAILNYLTALLKN